MPRVIAFFVAFLCLLNLLAQQDSLRTYRIQEVYVSGSLEPSGKRSATPLQRLDGAMLSSINSLLVSDATRFFSGAVIKDYGGIGGMKTLSVRSMGA
ncbi:MAG: TonB-dependent receptor, partial [Bacteroidales bacterium]|nr:TonB-dependent receptor [Bacteroidales bacterium]